MMSTAADGGSRRTWSPDPQLRLVDGPPPDDDPSPPLNPPNPSVDEQVVALYQAEYRGIARLAYLLVGDRHRAEDLAHDAFVKLYEHWDSLQDKRKALAYLRSTTSNLAMSVHRRRKTARKHEGAPIFAAPDASSKSAEAEALSRSSRPDVVNALQQLSPKQRTAVVLKHWLRMTEGEIAEALGCSIGSTRTHLSRGHDALAKKLAKKLREDR